MNTSRRCCGSRTTEVEEETSSSRAKEARTLFTEKFASSGQSPRPSLSAMCNAKFEECSLLTGLGLALVERMSVSCELEWGIDVLN